MNSLHVDSLTRACATRLSRRTVLGLVGIGAVAMPIARGVASVRAQTLSDAQNLVVQFYETIDAYQYQDAYALLGSAWHAEQSERNFIAGYHNTAFVQCKITGTKARGNSTVVSVELISWHNDGKIVAYDGSYTVGHEDSTLLILAGDATPKMVPDGTPPLCTTDDVEFSLGPWNAGAGNRFSTVVATSTSDTTCVLGGVPRVTLSDRANNTVVSTSEPGAAPEAIVLRANGSAQAQLRFANWCGDTDDPRSVTIEVPGDLLGTAAVAFDDNGISFPPCLGAGEDAVLQLQGWTAVNS